MPASTSPRTLAQHITLQPNLSHVDLASAASIFLLPPSKALNHTSLICGQLHNLCLTHFHGPVDMMHQRSAWAADEDALLRQCATRLVNSAIPNERHALRAGSLGCRAMGSGLPLPRHSTTQRCGGAARRQICHKSCSALPHQCRLGFRTERKPKQCRERWLHHLRPDLKIKARSSACCRTCLLV